MSVANDQGHSYLSPVRTTIPMAAPDTRVVPKNPMFSASRGLSFLAVAFLVRGKASPVREELSTLAELHQMKRISAGILSPDLCVFVCVSVDFFFIRKAKKQSAEFDRRRHDRSGIEKMVLFVNDLL